MNYKFLLLFCIVLIVSSCSKDEEDMLQEIKQEELIGFTIHQINVINYFKEIALGFEFGNASSITRKWNSELRIFIGGEPNTELSVELEKIIMEINELATDGFQVTIVNDSLQSNYYIFFGSGTDYADLFPSQYSLISSNLGLFSLFWNAQNQFTSGHMYVDIIRTNLTEQKHLLREELTQSLGLARDSSKHPESIFQSARTSTTEYTLIDRDLIRLLYHPEMNIGLNEIQVDKVLRDILSRE